MSTYADFTANDWERLCDALLTSGELVIVASPQGALGTLKERVVYFAEISQLLQNGTAFGLIDELRLRLQSRLEEIQRSQPGEPVSVDQIRHKVLESCCGAAQTLLGRAEPQEIAYYKQGLLWACRQTALAVREKGGFLGIGAQQVTEEENEAIRQIAYALGLPAAEAIVEAPPAAPFRPGAPGFGELFTEDEWSTLCLAPLWLSLAVSAAAPSGTIGTAKELITMGRSLQEAAIRQPPNSLVATVVKDMTRNRAAIQLTGQPPLAGTAVSEQAAQEALEYCRKALALVEQKASPQDAGEYRHLLIDLARQVAESAKEGGASISPEEQHLLDELASMLGTE